MKHIKKIIVFIIVIILACPLLGCNQKNLIEIYVNDDSELIVLYDDGSDVNLGSAEQLKEDVGITDDNGEECIGIKSVHVNDRGELIVVLTDDTSLYAGVVDSVKNAEVAKYNLHIFLNELNKSDNFTTNIYEVTEEEEILFVEYKCTEDACYHKYYESERTYFKYDDAYFFTLDGELRKISERDYEKDYEMYKSTYGSLSDTAVSMFNLCVNYLDLNIFAYRDGEFTSDIMDGSGILRVKTRLDDKKLIVKFAFLNKNYMVEIYDVNQTQINIS